MTHYLRVPVSSLGPSPLPAVGVHGVVASSLSVCSCCGRSFVLLRPLGVLQIIVVVLDFFFDLLNFLRVFVEDVLLDKVGAFELFPRQRAQPLVLAQLLGIGLTSIRRFFVRKNGPTSNQLIISYLYKLFHFIVFVFHAKLSCFLLCQVSPRLDKAPHFLLEGCAVLLDLDGSYIAGRGNPSGMHNSTSTKCTALKGTHLNPKRLFVMERITKWQMLYQRED